MKTFREFCESQELEEGWKDYIPSGERIAAFGRNFADKATLGGYRHARAAVDYVVKKALGRKTTYKKELDQENEKLKSGEKNYPGTTVVGDIAGKIAPGLVAPEVTAAAHALKGAADAVNAYYPRVKKAIVGESQAGAPTKTYKQFVDTAKKSAPKSKTPEISRVLDPENFYYDDQGNRLELIPGKVDMKKDPESIFKGVASKMLVLKDPLKKVPHAVDDTGKKFPPAKVIILKAKPKTKKSE